MFPYAPPFNLDSVKILEHNLDTVKIWLNIYVCHPKSIIMVILKNALIQAGIEILSKEGIGGLSLRKVAKQAGVSYAAPYAHFKDRQSLIAAISTEGFRQLYVELDMAAFSAC